MESVQNTFTIFGGALMTPMIYHTCLNTSDNPALRFCTVLGIGFLTCGSLPRPPPVIEGQTSNKMMQDSLTYLAKTTFLVGIGCSLMMYVSKEII